jgi:hypothetical protein
MSPLCRSAYPTYGAPRKYKERRVTINTCLFRGTCGYLVLMLVSSMAYEQHRTAGLIVSHSTVVKLPSARACSAMCAGKGGRQGRQPREAGKARQAKFLVTINACL